MSNGKIDVRDTSGATKSVDNELLPEGLYRQRTQIGGAALAEIARVKSTEPAANDPGLVVRAVGAAAEDTLSLRHNRMTSLAKFEAAPGEEIRADDTLTDRYNGRAPDGTATSAPVWEVVRFYRDAGGTIVRVRYRTGVAWDSRTMGWS